MGRTGRSVLYWIVAVVVTLASARWQRMSGPTYPVSGEVMLGGQAIAVELTRTHGGDGDQPVRILVPDPEVRGEIAWRRYPTADAWVDLPMTRDGEWLAAALPHQPPAGKLEYQVRLTRGSETAAFPPRPAITRFKGDVPAAVLIPHIFAMFFGMLLSSRAGLEALAAAGRPAMLARLTLLLIGRRRLHPRPGGAEVRVRRVVDRSAVRLGPHRQQDPARRRRLGVGGVAPARRPFRPRRGRSRRARDAGRVRHPAQRLGLGDRLEHGREAMT